MIVRDFDEEIKVALEKKLESRKRHKIIVAILYFVIVFVGVIFFVSDITGKNNSEKNITTEDKATYMDAVEATTTTEDVLTEAYIEIATELEPQIDILEELGIEIPEKDLDFDVLHQENENIYAWIYIPGTLVDYPVLQHPTDNSYYLQHNIDGSYGYPGCIYTELYNKKDFSDRNTLVYGHNMADGTMFASLHYFENSQNFEENQYIFIYMEDKVYVYHIFAAYAFPGIHLMKHFDYTDDVVYEEYLNDVFSGNYYGFIRKGVEVTTNNKIITLSTCIGGQPDMRYLVQGVLLNEENGEVTYGN